MKKLILLFTFFCSYSYLSAQGATLTKEETVNYINKKLREVEGYTKTNSDGKTASIISQNMVLRDGKIYRELEREFLEYDFVQSYGPRDLKTVITDHYNPTHIQSIEVGTNPNESEAVGLIVIKLLPKSSKMNIKKYARAPKVDQYNDNSYNMDNRTINQLKSWNAVPEETSENSEAYLYYLKSDPANFNKIKKALEYLQELLKAEDDPFGG